MDVDESGNSSDEGVLLDTTRDRDAVAAMNDNITYVCLN